MKLFSIFACERFFVDNESFFCNRPGIACLLIAIPPSDLALEMKRTSLAALVTTLVFIYLPALASANSGDFAGAMAIGTGYAAIITAPINGLAVQGNVGIGTSTPVNLLDIGTSGGIHIASGVPSSTSMALYNNSGTLTWNGITLSTGSSVSGTTNYVPVFTGSNSLGNSAIYQSSSNIGIGTTSPLVSFDLSQKTDALALPVGTTGQRPTGTNGQIRYNSSLSAIEAYANGIWTSLTGAGAIINSSGQLLCGGNVSGCIGSSTLSYCPYKGNLKTTALYGNYTIPSGTAASGCLTASLTSMYIGGTASQSAAANTLYYVYLINVSGTTYLDLETTGHTTDSSTGIEIMSGSGGNTRTLVGMIGTDGSSTVSTTQNTSYLGSVNTVATWDNRRPTVTFCAFSSNRHYCGVTMSEVNSENRCYFMTWGDAATLSSWLSASVDQSVTTELDVQGDSAVVSFATTTTASNGGYLQMVPPAAFIASEGYHHTTLLAENASQCTTFFGGGSAQYITVFSIQ